MLPIYKKYISLDAIFIKLDTLKKYKSPSQRVFK